MKKFEVSIQQNKIIGTLRGIATAKNNDMACFLNEADTDIPMLQTHCHHITAPLRRKHAKDALKGLRVLVKSIINHLKGVEEQDEHHRIALSTKWGSSKLTRRLNKVSSPY